MDLWLIINYSMKTVFNNSFAKGQNYFSHSHFYTGPLINLEDVLIK